MMLSKVYKLREKVVGVSLCVVRSALKSSRQGHQKTEKGRRMIQTHRTRICKVSAYTPYNSSHRSSIVTSPANDPPHAGIINSPHVLIANMPPKNKAAPVTMFTFPGSFSGAKTCSRRNAEKVDSSASAMAPRPL